MKEQYDGDDKALYEFATANYPRETQIYSKIVDFIEKQFGEKVRMDEISYIIILLRKLVK